MTCSWCRILQSIWEITLTSSNQNLTARLLSHLPASFKKNLAWAVKPYYLVTLTILFLAVGLRVIDPPILSQFRLLVFDTYQKLSPRQALSDSPVVVIDIDEASLQRLGQWPWPRTTMTTILARLREAGTAAVGFDILFSEPDRLSPEQVLKYWPKFSKNKELRAQITQLGSHDTQFAKEISAGNVAMGIVLTRQNRNKALKPKASFAFGGDDPKLFIPGFPGVISNLAQLNKAANGAGFLNWAPDSDQIMRRIPLLMKSGNILLPTLSIETLRIAQGAGTYVIKSSGASGVESFGSRTGIDSVRVGEVIIPTNAAGQMLIHFAYRDPRRYIPAWKIFENKIDPSRLEGRIALIGASAAGLFDIRATPLESALPGVEVHAQAIEQILTGRFLQRPDFALGAEIIFLIVLVITIIVLQRSLSAAYTALLGGIIIAILAEGSYWLFVNWGWLADPVYPTLSALAVYVTGSLISFIESEAQRQRIRSAFGFYLAPEMVQKLTENPDQLVLGGEKRELTLLFSDIRGFTTISEGLEADVLVSMINKILTPLSDAIMEHRGTIDKYMGDAIMAFWNAPLDDKDHAKNAALAALDMLARLRVLNQSLKDEAKEKGETSPDIQMGVGLNTGMCSVGNMGSEQRFDYSVLGDSVNVAARLEGQTKTYGVDILLGEETAQAIEDMACIEIDLIVVKGKSRPVAIFALLGDETMANSQKFKSLIEAQAHFLSAYRSQNWNEAKSCLKNCRELAPELELLHEIYASRIAQYQKTPPSENWDGAYISQSK
jgi:adenylate cyclase